MGIGWKSGDLIRTASGRIQTLSPNVKAPQVPYLRQLSSDMPIDADLMTTERGSAVLGVEAASPRPL